MLKNSKGHDRGGLARPRQPRPRGLGERGSIALQTAIAMLVLLGMISLGVEVTTVLLRHRQMQTAADAAAMAGVRAMGISADSIALEARAVAAQHGFVNGVDRVSVAVNVPPTLGSHAGDASYVEVFVGQPQTPILAQLIRAGDFAPRARAVATTTLTAGACILALDSSASQSVLLNQNVVMKTDACSVISNSSSSSALTLLNNATISGPTYVHGGTALSNGAHLNGAPNVTSGNLTADPYAAVVLPTVPACTGQSGAISGTKTLTAGHFCSGLTLANNATLNLSPGVYYIDSTFKTGNGVTINGTGGVTIVINNSFAMNVGNNGIFNLTAPKTGATSGLVFYSRPTNTSTITQGFLNNAEMTIVGAMYFPSQILRLANNAVTAPGRCTQIIARKIIFDNNVQFNSSCNDTGVLPIGGLGSKLVE